MTGIGHDRIIRKLDAAEGYLMLGMADRALEILQARDEWATMQFEASLLTGDALRTLGRHRDAIRPLELAARLRPTDPGVALALGWCYKRTHRLAQAIASLERAASAHPDVALLHYNLACYWSLAGDDKKALKALAESLRLDPDFQDKIEGEPDFDPLRAHPDFPRSTSGNPSSA